MSAALTAPSIAVASSRDAAERYLDLVRDHQQRYLEAAGAAAAEVRGIRRLECVAASTLQLSRQFFDAQRAIVDRVGRHEADLLGHDADADLLDLDAWDAGAATRQLAALLDSWWVALNSSAGRAMDEAAARQALVRQVDRIEQAHVATGATAWSAPTGSCLPRAVREVLERSDSSDLESVLRDLSAVLSLRGRPAAAGAADSVPIGASAVEAPRRIDTATGAARVPDATDGLRILDIDVHGGVATQVYDGPLTRLERLEQDRRRFWNEPERADRAAAGAWFPTPAVASIAAATAALSTALALIG